MTNKYKKIEDKKLEREIALFIRDLGIFPHLKGYQAIIEAVKLSIEDSEYLKAVTTKLYPAIAEKIGGTGSNVERAIRHAISLASQDKPAEMSALFHGLKSPPTNAMFIATVAEEIQYQLDI